MNAGSVRQDVDKFQAAVKGLSGKIGAAGALWNDEKFAELNAAMRVIASMSRDIMMIGDKFYASIDRFDRISAEEY